MNLPLFDLPAASSQLPVAKQQPESSDVLRIIEPKGGPPRELKNGQLTGREFQILELEDGRFFWRFTDNGERRPAPAGCTKTLIDDAIYHQVFVEVERGA